MYFVVIDLQQLYTRLWNSSMGELAAALDEWLARQGFRPGDGGWIASADAINAMSCTEILSSEPIREMSAR